MRWQYEDDPRGYEQDTTQGSAGSIFSDPFAIQLLTNPQYMAAWKQATNQGGVGGGSGAGAGYFPADPNQVMTPLPGMSPIYTPNLGAAATGAANTANTAAAATAGATTVPTGKSKMIDALPVLAGLLFGSQGPFGSDQGDGLGGMTPDLQSILNLMKQRMSAQGPLFSAVNQGAYNLLPNSAKSGGMFGLPSSSGGG